MICPFQQGDLKIYKHTVTGSDFARFETGEVHQVYATFALARDAEWSGRLFVLEMKEDHEEGIGTGITVDHLSPAMEGEEVVFKAVLIAVKGNEISTRFEATAGDRLIARGTQKQKIINKEKLTKLFTSIKSNMK